MVYTFIIEKFLTRGKTMKSRPGKKPNPSKDPYYEFLEEQEETLDPEILNEIIEDKTLAQGQVPIPMVIEKSEDKASENKPKQTLEESKRSEGSKNKRKRPLEVQQ